MSKITPYTALCDIFRNKINTNDKLVTSDVKLKGDPTIEVPIVAPQNTLMIANSCQTDPSRDYSLDTVMKVRRKPLSAKNNLLVKDDNFQILRPDYAAYSAERPYSQAIPARHNKFKLIAEKPQEETEKYNFLDKLRGRSSSPKEKYLTEIYRNLDIKHDVSTSAERPLQQRKIPENKCHTNSIVHRMSNELLFPDLNLYSKNIARDRDREYSPQYRNKNLKPINSFKEQKIHALYRTVSDLKQEFEERYPHCDDEDEKCLCEHCGAWAVINESLKRPQIFENMDEEEQPRPHKHSKKRNDKEYLKLLMKLKLMEDRINELEEITYIQGPIKVGKSSLTFDMYTQCHKKKKRTRFQEPEQSRSFSPKRFNPKNCPFSFGLPPNLKKKLFGKRPAEENPEPEDTESDEEIKVEHDSRSKRRRLLPRPKLRCHDYIKKKNDEDTSSKKPGFWKHNKQTKQTYHVHSLDNSDELEDDNNNTEENKAETIEIDLDTITDKQIQDLLIELNKRKNRISSPEAKFVRFHVTPSQNNNETKVLFSRSKDDMSSYSAVPSETELENIKYTPRKEPSQQSVSKYDSFDYFFLKNPQQTKIELEPKQTHKRDPSIANIKPTRITMEPKDYCSITSNEKVKNEIKVLVENIIKDTTSNNMCRFFNNNYSTKTSTTNESQVSNTKSPRCMIPVNKNRIKPKKHVEHTAKTLTLEANKKKLNLTLPNSKDIKNHPKNDTIPLPKNFVELNKNVKQNLRSHQFQFDTNFFYHPRNKTKPQDYKNNTVSFNSQISPFNFDNENEQQSKKENRKKWNYHCLDIEADKCNDTNNRQSKENILLKLSNLPIESTISSFKIFQSDSIAQTDDSKDEGTAISDAESNISDKKDVQSGYSIENAPTETDSAKTEQKFDLKPEKSKDSTKKTSFFSVFKNFSKQFIPKKSKPIPTPQLIKPVPLKPLPRPVEAPKNPAPLVEPPVKTKIPVFLSPDRNTNTRPCSAASETRASSGDSAKSRKQKMFPTDQNINVVLCVNKKKNKKRLKFKGAEKFDKYCMFKPQMIDKGTKLSEEDFSINTDRNSTDLSINTNIMSNIESFFQCNSNNSTTVPFSNIIVFTRPRNLPIIREQSSTDSVFSNLSVQTNLLQNLPPTVRSIANNKQLVLYTHCSSPSCKKCTPHSETIPHGCTKKSNILLVKPVCGKEQCDRCSRVESYCSVCPSNVSVCPATKKCPSRASKVSYECYKPCGESSSDLICTEKKKSKCRFSRKKCKPCKETSSELVCKKKPTQESCKPCKESSSELICKKKPTCTISEESCKPCKDSSSELICKKKKKSKCKISREKCKPCKESSSCQSCKKKKKSICKISQESCKPCKQSSSVVICQTKKKPKCKVSYESCKPCKESSSGSEVVCSSCASFIIVEEPPPKCNRKRPTCQPAAPPCCPLALKCSSEASIPPIPSYTKLPPIEKTKTSCKPKDKKPPWYMTQPYKPKTIAPAVPKCNEKKPCRSKNPEPQQSNKQFRKHYNKQEDELSCEKRPLLWKKQMCPARSKSQIPQNQYNGQEDDVSCCEKPCKKISFVPKPKQCTVRPCRQEPCGQESNVQIKFTDEKYDTTISIQEPCYVKPETRNVDTCTPIIETFPKTMYPKKPPSTCRGIISRGEDKATSAINIPNKQHTSICVGTQAFAADCKTRVHKKCSATSIESQDSCTKTVCNLRKPPKPKTKCGKVKETASTISLSKSSIHEFELNLQKLSGKKPKKANDCVESNWKCGKTKGAKIQKRTSTISLSKSSLHEFEENLQQMRGKKPKESAREKHNDCVPYCKTPTENRHVPKPSKKHFTVEPKDSLTITVSRSSASISPNKKIEIKFKRPHEPVEQESQESSSTASIPEKCKKFHPKPKPCPKKCHKNKLERKDSDTSQVSSTSIISCQQSSSESIKESRKPKKCHHKETPPCHHRSSEKTKKHEKPEKTHSLCSVYVPKKTCHKPPPPKVEKHVVTCKCPPGKRKLHKSGVCLTCKRPTRNNVILVSKPSHLSTRSEKSVRICSKTKTIKPKCKKSKTAVKPKPKKSKPVVKCSSSCSILQCLNEKPSKKCVKAKSCSKTRVPKAKPKRKESKKSVKSKSSSSCLVSKAPKKKPSKKSVKSKSSSSCLVSKAPKKKPSKKSVKSKTSSCSLIILEPKHRSSCARSGSSVCSNKSKTSKSKICKNHKYSGSKLSEKSSESKSKSSSKSSSHHSSNTSVCSICNRQTLVRMKLRQVKSGITSKFSCKYLKNLYRRPICAMTSRYKQRQMQKKHNFCGVTKHEYKKEPEIKSRSSSRCPCSSSIINLFCNVNSSFYDNDDTYSYSETDEDLILSSEEKRQYLMNKLQLLQDFRIDPGGMSNYGAFQ